MKDIKTCNCEQDGFQGAVNNQHCPIHKDDLLEEHGHFESKSLTPPTTDWEEQANKLKEEVLTRICRHHDIDEDSDFAGSIDYALTAMRNEAFSFHTNLARTIRDDLMELALDFEGGYPPRDIKAVTNNVIKQYFKDRFNV